MIEHENTILYFLKQNQRDKGQTPGATFTYME